MNAKPLVLLGRDWMHSNLYVSSTLHQVLIFWIDDKVKVMSVGYNPLSKDAMSIEAIVYSTLMQPIMVITIIEEFYEAKAC